MHKCPRCQSELKSAEKDHFCPKHHGALLTLNELQQQTSQKFTRWFFASWLQFGNKRTISCPSCNSKMLLLTVEGRNKFELDCCPSCFSIWLDSGEDVLLNKLFRKHIEAETIRDLSSEQHQILAKHIIEHDKKLQRYKFLAKIGRQFGLILREGTFIGYEGQNFFLHMLIDQEKDQKN